MLRAVLWDLDGTLVDSADQHWQSWRETLAAEGVAVTREQFEETFGQRNDAVLAHWLDPGTPPARRQRIGAAKEVRYRELVARTGLTPLPGVTHWVAQLRRRDWRQAVASSAPRRNVEVVVEALGLHTYLDVLVGAEDVCHGKPDPEVFLTAAERLAIPSSACVVVEDAPAGVEAAKRAGMACIGVGRADLIGADLRVASLQRLPSGAFDDLIDGKRSRSLDGRFGGLA